MLLLGPHPAHHDAVAELVREALGQGCRIDRTSAPRRALGQILQDAHDLYVIVLSSPIADALELVRTAARCKGPVIALVDRADDHVEMLAIDAGATDCVVHAGLSAKAFGRAARHAIGRQQRLCVIDAKRAMLQKEKSRLNALQDVSRRLALRSCHDIRSPLTVIKTFSSILLGDLRTNGDGEQIELLQTIMQRVDDVAGMLDGILDASELAADLVGSYREATSVERLVARSRELLQEAASLSGVELVFTLDASLPDVFCDRGNIDRVIQDLVARACKAAGRGGRVELWARHDPADGSVRIGVTDDRAAILDGSAPAFDPQDQLQERQVQTNDTDLLSYVVRELVRINLGSLTVSSPPSGGSTAAFTVPVVDLERILSAHLTVLAAGTQTVSSLSVILHAPESTENWSAAAAALIGHELRACDLVIPIGAGLWALCVTCDSQEVDGIIERISGTFHHTPEGKEGSSLRRPTFASVATWPITASAAEIAATVMRTAASPVIE